MPATIGLIGCGAISEHYLPQLARFPSVRVVACADLDPARARHRAQQFQVARVLTPQELISAPDIDIVLNLTIPAVHAEIAIQALSAGKHVHSEKPLAVTREDGRKVVQAAAARSRRAGCAPDTFLGAAYQTCRKLIDDGVIGRPFGATANMVTHSNDNWPAFMYQPGGGPLFDMAPYYLNALVFLLGPMRRVAGAATIPVPDRMVAHPGGGNATMKVAVPTHVAGLIEFHQGAVATLLQTSETWRANLPWIEIYGTEGTLACPDPNRFDGPIRLYTPAAGGKPGEWRDIAYTHPYSEPSRGLGVVDLARAVAENRPHRASAELAYHVLDAMQACYDSWQERRWIDLASTCAQPEPLPVNGIAGA